MADKTAHVVEKSNEIGFSLLPSDKDRRAVHDVGLPDVVRQFGLVAPPVHRGCFPLHEPLPFEEPPHRALGQGLLGIHQAALARGADQAAHGSFGHLSA